MLKNHMTRATWYECIPKPYTFSCGKGPKHINCPSSTFSNATFILSQYIDFIGNFFLKWNMTSARHIYISLFTQQQPYWVVLKLSFCFKITSTVFLSIFGKRKKLKTSNQIAFFRKKEWSVHYLIFTLHTCNWVVAKKCLAKPLRCHISCKYQQWQKSNYF